jgi:hypothetical protein
MRRALALFLISATIACAEPPNKEMNQAQGAIDAAKSAGAEQFAASDLTAAVDALRRSEAAVSQRDYRLALNHAIESRERAQSAAKAAVNVRARARGDAEAQLAEANTLLAQAQMRLRNADRARLPRRVAEDARAVIAAAQKSVQNARTALDNDEYDKARKALDGVSARIQTVISAMAQALDGAVMRRRR